MLIEKLAPWPLETEKKLKSVKHDSSCGIFEPLKKKKFTFKNVALDHYIANPKPRLIV